MAEKVVPQAYCGNWPLAALSRNASLAREADLGATMLMAIGATVGLVIATIAMLDDVLRLTANHLSDHAVSRRRAEKRDERS